MRKPITLDRLVHEPALIWRLGETEKHPCKLCGKLLVWGDHPCRKCSRRIQRERTKQARKTAR